jgi:hypothetical protein
MGFANARVDTRLSFSGGLSVGRLLAQLGITRRKPLHRAIERDEALVR